MHTCAAETQRTYGIGSPSDRVGPWEPPGFSGFAASAFTHWAILPALSVSFTSAQPSSLPPTDRRHGEV